MSKLKDIITELFGKHIDSESDFIYECSTGFDEDADLIMVRRDNVSSNSNNLSSGIGILGILQIIFIVLKLVGVIDWSWWQVFIPGIIEIVLFIIVSIIIWILD